MFRLTKEHIGKKVRAKKYQDLRWLIPLTYDNNRKEIDEQIICLKDGSIGEACRGRTFKRNRWSGYNNDWEFYKKNDQEVFDFARFGCNGQIVKELVAELDRRYILKEAQ